MENINKDWILTRLKGRHGEKAEIATAMGIDIQKLSKVLSGKRQIQVTEIPGLISHFTHGFAEAAGSFTPQAVADITKNAGDRISAAARAVVTPDAHIAIFRVYADEMAFGLLAGDIMVVDLRLHAANGDIVIVTETDIETGSCVTHLARLAGDMIVPSTPNFKPVQIGDSQAHAVVGKVIASIRATWTID